MSGYESASRVHVARRPGSSRRRPPARLAPFAFAAVAAALVVATNLIDFGADRERVRLLDAGAEWSWSHIFATVAFAVGSLAGVLGARASGPRRRTWRAIGVLFGVLLLDNTTRLHTHISFWPVLYAPVLLGLYFAIWRAARGTPDSVFVLAGLATLFASLGIHVFGPHVVHALGWGSDGWAYQVKVGLKEGTELAGWTLVVPALWRLHRPPMVQDSGARRPPDRAVK